MSRKNLVLLLSLWLFALGIAGTVFYLMILRGPAVTP